MPKILIAHVLGEYSVFFTKRTFFYCPFCQKQQRVSNKKLKAGKCSCGCGAIFEAVRGSIRVKTDGSVSKGNKFIRAKKEV